MRVPSPSLHIFPSIRSQNTGFYTPCLACECKRNFASCLILPTTFEGRHHPAVERSRSAVRLLTCAERDNDRLHKRELTAMPLRAVRVQSASFLILSSMASVDANDAIGAQSRSRSRYSSLESSRITSSLASNNVPIPRGSSTFLGSRSLGKEDESAPPPFLVEGLPSRLSASSSSLA